MGNQAMNVSRSKSEIGTSSTAADFYTSSPDQVIIRRHKPTSTASTTLSLPRHDIVSTPADFVGATPYPRADTRRPPDTFPRPATTGGAEFIEPPLPIQVKVLPSFGPLSNDGLANTSHRSIIYSKEPVVNIKIYRRSGEIGRSGGSSVAESGDGWEEIDRESRRARGRSAEPPSLRSSNPYSGVDTPSVAGGSRVIERRTMMGSESALSSARVSAAPTPAPPAVVQTPDWGPRREALRRDLPSGDTVRDRVRMFEERFVETLVRRFGALPSGIARAAILSVAIHMRCTPHRHVTMYRYLVKRDVPAQLLVQDEENSGEYIPTIPDSLLILLLHLRQILVSSEGEGGVTSPELDELQQALGEEIVRAIGSEAAAELSRMFEYQIGLLSEPTSVHLFADHTVECAVNFSVRRRGVWERNSLVRGAVFGQFEDDPLREGNEEGEEGEGGRGNKFVSVIIGEKELKWDLYEILKKPGLRKDCLLFGAPTMTSPSSVLPVWHFQTSTECESLLYGYRGLMLDWDYFAQTYSVVVEDEKWFNQKVASSPEVDFHQLYCPQRILIGTDLMRQYTAQRSKDKGSLRDYVRRKLSAAGVMFSPSDYPSSSPSPPDFLEPVYRPMSALSLTSSALKKADMDRADLTRVRLAGADLSRASFRSAVLCHACLTSARLGTTSAERYRGANIDYVNAIDAVLPDALLTAVASAHYALAVSGSRRGELQAARVERGGGGTTGVDGSTLLCDREGCVSSVAEAFQKIKEHYVQQKELERREREEVAAAAAASQAAAEQAAAAAAQAAAAAAATANVKSKAAGHKKTKRKSTLISNGNKDGVTAKSLDFSSSVSVNNTLAPSDEIKNNNPPPSELSDMSKTVMLNHKNNNNNNNDDLSINSGSDPRFPRSNESNVVHLFDELGFRETENRPNSSSTARLDSAVPAAPEVGAVNGTVGSTGDLAQPQRMDSVSRNTQIQDDYESGTVRDIIATKNEKLTKDEKVPKKSKTSKSSPYKKSKKKDQESESNVAAEITSPPVTKPAEISSGLINRIVENRRQDVPDVVGAVTQTSGDKPDVIKTADDSKITTKKRTSKKKKNPYDPTSDVNNPILIIDDSPKISRKINENRQHASKDGGQTWQDANKVSVAGNSVTKSDVVSTGDETGSTARFLEDQMEGRSYRSAPVSPSANQETPKSASKGHVVNRATPGVGLKEESLANERTPGTGSETLTNQVLPESGSKDHVPRIVVDSPKAKIYQTSCGYLSEVHGSLPALAFDDDNGQVDVRRSPLSKSRSMHAIDGLSFDPSRSRSRGGSGNVPRTRALSQSDIKNINKSQVFQIINAELRVADIQTALPSLDQSAFTGRSRELEDVTDLLGSSGRVVVIVGTHGIGKSSLALAVCRDLLNQSSFTVPSGRYESAGSIGEASMGGGSIGGGSLTEASAHKLSSVRVDMRGCVSVEAVILRLVRAFDLRFKSEERIYLYNWLNAHCRGTASASRRLLVLLLDNLDLPEDEHSALTDLLDELVNSVRDLRLLCTSRRPFFSARGSGAGGAVNHEIYRLGDVGEAKAKEMLGRLLPDLHEDGIQSLVSACDRVPFALRVVASCFNLGASASIDVGTLFEGLTTNRSTDLPASLQSRLALMSGDDDFARRRLFLLSRVILTILELLPSTPSLLLTRASCFPATFDLDRASKVVGSGATRAELEGAVKILTSVGLVERIGNKFPARYSLPPLVRLVAGALLSDGGVAEKVYMTMTLVTLVEASGRFHSRESLAAIQSAQDMFDDIEDVIIRTVEREQVMNTPELVSFASPEGAAFLSELLSERVYLALYDQLAHEAGVGLDTGAGAGGEAGLEAGADPEVAVDSHSSSGDASLQSRSLACLSYRHAVYGNIPEAVVCADRAYGLLAARRREEIGGGGRGRGGEVKEGDVAFVLYCLGKAVWLNGDEEPRERKRGLGLVKQSFELMKQSTRLYEVRTLYAGELYCWMLIREDNHQTARHWYNLFDAAVRDRLDKHPMTIDGLESRRVIWDRQSLFERAAGAAAKAVEAARSYYGDHPLTATMLAQLGEAYQRKGCLNEAISAAAGAVSMRIKVLGDHADTAASYNALAQLMIRSGQYDRAAAFGRNALDVLERLECGEAEGMGGVEGKGGDAKLREEALGLVDRAMCRSSLSLARTPSPPMSPPA